MWESTSKGWRVAEHFASHFANCRDITPHRIRKCLDMTILWQGNAISCMKSFGRLDCTLCMQERLHILKNSTESPTQLINTSNEIYGACRHKTRFHRYSSKTTTPDTDDAHAEKRSNQDKLLVDVWLLHFWSIAFIILPFLLFYY